MFFTEPDARIGSGPAPIVGAVGQLQFDVMLFRLESEYGAPAKLESIGYGNPRWIVGKPSDVQKIGQAHGRLLVYDHKGNPIVLFADRWALRMAMERETGVEWLEEAP